VIKITICRKSNLCKGYIVRQDGQRGFLSKSCFECRLDRKKMADKYRNKILKPYFKKNKQNQNTAKSLKRKNARLRIKVITIIILFIIIIII